MYANLFSSFYMLYLIHCSRAYFFFFLGIQISLEKKKKGNQGAILKCRYFLGRKKRILKHKTLCNIRRSPILAAVKNGVKKIQAAAYNGARTVHTWTSSWSKVNS